MMDQRRGRSRVHCTERPGEPGLVDGVRCGLHELVEHEFEWNAWDVVCIVWSKRKGSHVHDS